VELYLHSPNTPPWRGAQFKKGTGTTLPLSLLDQSCPQMWSVVQGVNVNVVNVITYMLHGAGYLKS
jgi:hypothetical protein